MTEWLVAGVSGTAMRRCQVGEQEGGFTSSSPGLHHARARRITGSLIMGSLITGSLLTSPSITTRKGGWLTNPPQSPPGLHVGAERGGNPTVLSHSSDTTARHTAGGPPHEAKFPHSPLSPPVPPPAPFWPRLPRRRRARADAGRDERGGSGAGG